MLTLLQIVQAAQGELGLPVQTSVVGNTDATTVQMFALINRSLDMLRRMNRWTALQFEYDLIVNVPVTITGNTTSNSPIITNVNYGSITPSNLVNNYIVIGNNIPQNARVLSETPTTLTMEMNATGTATGQVFTLAQDTYPMPAGFDWMNNRTMWDRTNRWELLGPDSPQLDQWHRSGIVATGPRRHFRQIGPFSSQFRIWPPPFEIINPLQLVFEYLSTASVGVHGSSTLFAQYYANDDDISVLDDQAILLGLKWLFWQIKGFNYVDMKNDWLDYAKKLAAKDGAAPTLPLVQHTNPLFISPANVQDGFFPGPVGPNQS